MDNRFYKIREEKYQPSIKTTKEEKMLAEGWVFITNVDDEKFQDTLHNYERKYGKNAVQLVDEAYDVFDRRLTSHKALYVKKKILDAHKLHMERLKGL